MDALLGQNVWEQMPAPYRPQRVRNDHLHRGEFFGSEFIPQAMMSTYRDPTFEMAARTSSQISQAVFIEWLRRGGLYVLPPRHGRTKVLIDRHPRCLLVTVAAVGVGVGIALGRILG